MEREKVVKKEDKGGENTNTRGEGGMKRATIIVSRET